MKREINEIIEKETQRLENIGCEVTNVEIEENVVKFYVNDYNNDCGNFHQIRKMFIKMDEKSEKNRKYAEYKDNVYSLNEIEKSLKDFKDMNNILYKDIQPDKVFDFIGYSRKDNEFI